MLTFMYNIIDFVLNTKFSMCFILCASPFWAMSLVWCATHFRGRGDY